MTVSFGRSARIALALGIGMALVGCTSIRDRQGYFVDEVLISSVQPGVDNLQSVQATLGRPTFTGQFTDRDWYYVSRETRQLAFNHPKPVEQTVLHVRFDEAGNVVSVERSGLEQVVSIDPMDAETPTLGRDRGFFQELFGNIGQVGAPGMSAPTADNPQ
jgi:outer membrane protein assembly factor BamE (lipoprotein component of BamABCDE complex)